MTLQRFDLEWPNFAWYITYRYGVSHVPMRRGRGPSVPKISSDPYVRQNGLTWNDEIWCAINTCEVEACFRGQPRPILRGRVPSVPPKRDSLPTSIPFDLKWPNLVLGQQRVSRGSTTPTSQRGGAQRPPILEPLRMPHRATKFDMVTQVGYEHVSRGQARPRPEGRGPSVPKILWPTCAHTVWKTTTKFCIGDQRCEENFLQSITNADARSDCGSEPSCYVITSAKEVMFSSAYSLYMFVSRLA